MHGPWCNVFESDAVPETFNELEHVVEFANVVFPETFNVDTNVDGLFIFTTACGFVIAL